MLGPASGQVLGEGAADTGKGRGTGQSEDISRWICRRRPQRNSILTSSMWMVDYTQKVHRFFLESWTCVKQV